MSARDVSAAKAGQTAVAQPVALLERSHSCGRHSDDTQRCTSCRSGGGLIQRCAENGDPGCACGVDEVLHMPGQPLEPHVRSEMGRRFGTDFSRVRVHSDPVAAESARAVGAKAYTFGSDIVFGAGRYAPGTFEGDRLLAHELTHVVQQASQARVQGSPPRLGDPGDHAEREAERVASDMVNVPGRVGERVGIAADATPSIRRQPDSDQPRPGSAAWMASQHIPLAKSVEQTHWASPADRDRFIREYLDYTRTRPELRREYEEGQAAYGPPTGERAAPPSAAPSTAPGPAVGGAAGAGGPHAPAQPAHSSPPRLTPHGAQGAAHQPPRTVRTVQFLHFGTFNENLVTATLPEGAVQTGPDPSAGYNFDTYLVNASDGRVIPAQWLGGDRYRVFMGTPECPGCHFGHGLEVDLAGENPLMIMLPAMADAAVAASDAAAARAGATVPRPGGGPATPGGGNFVGPAVSGELSPTAGLRQRPLPPVRIVLPEPPAPLEAAGHAPTAGPPRPAATAVPTGPPNVAAPPPVEVPRPAAPVIPEPPATGPVRAPEPATVPPAAAPLPAPAPVPSTPRTAVAASRVADAQSALTLADREIALAGTAVAAAETDLAAARAAGPGGRAAARQAESALRTAQARLQRLERGQTTARRELAAATRGRTEIFRLETEVARLRREMEAELRPPGGFSAEQHRAGRRPGVIPPIGQSSGARYHQLDAQLRAAERRLADEVRGLTRSLDEQVEAATPGRSARPVALRNAAALDQPLRPVNGVPIDVTTGRPMTTTNWATDHIMPRAEIAGDPRFARLAPWQRDDILLNVEENYLPFTSEANSAKSDYTVDEWIARRATSGRRLPDDVVEALRAADRRARAAIKARFIQFLSE